MLSVSSIIWGQDRIYEFNTYRDIINGKVKKPVSNSIKYTLYEDDGNYIVVERPSGKRYNLRFIKREGDDIYLHGKEYTDNCDYDKGCDYYLKFSKTYIELHIKNNITGFFGGEIKRKYYNTNNGKVVAIPYKTIY